MSLIYTLINLKWNISKADFAFLLMTHRLLRYKHMTHIVNTLPMHKIVRPRQPELRILSALQRSRPQKPFVIRGVAVNWGRVWALSSMLIHLPTPGRAASGRHCLPTKSGMPMALAPVAFRS